MKKLIFDLDEVFCAVYAVCHVLGMSSACANPVIYGFLNENFSKEFRLIGEWWKDRIIDTLKLCCPKVGRLASNPTMTLLNHQQEQRGKFSQKKLKKMFKVNHCKAHFSMQLGIFVNFLAI